MARIPVTPDGQFDLARATTDPTLLRELSYTSYAHVREAVCANPHTAPGTMQNLLQTATTAQLVALASNPGAPGAILTSIVNRPWCPDEVQQALATNPNTPAEVLADLMDWGTFAVRMLAANNPRTPMTRIMASCILGYRSDTDFIAAGLLAHNLVTGPAEAELGALAAVRSWDLITPRPNSDDVDHQKVLDQAVEAVTAWRAMTPSAKALALELWTSLPDSTPALDILHAAADVKPSRAVSTRVTASKVRQIPPNSR